MTRAADKLGMAVQTVSAQVRELERALGFALLKPSGRGLVLTAAGAAALKQADLILADGSHLEGLRKVIPKKFGRMRFQLRDAYESGWALFDFEKFQTVLSGDVELEEPAR